MSTAKIMVGDVRKGLALLPTESVQTVVTSPPYWGLRDYGHDGQIGLEQTPEAYVAQMVEVFDAVWRVLANDGTVWLNLGDSYVGYKGDNYLTNKEASKLQSNTTVPSAHMVGTPQTSGLKSKDLVGIPWRVAFALQDAGWYLRQDIIWQKPNPMPESVTDRCTKAHEYLFLLSKQPRYYFDNNAIKERAVADVGEAQIRFGGNKYGDSDDPKHATKSGNAYGPSGTRNKRDVWTIASKPFKGAHFAVMPEALAEPCVLAGSKPGDLVLDPFAGSGTVGLVSLRNGRNFVGCELNPEYAQIAKERIGPLLTEIVEGETE
jgi:DNA modification methylase